MRRPPVRRMVPLAAVISAATLSSALAGAPLPLPDGAYCGPDGARIGIDSGTDSVTIAGYTCGIPIFAADKLQSIQCRRGDGPLERREFDVRVLDGAMLYNGRWFRPCKAP